MNCFSTASGLGHPGSELFADVASEVPSYSGRPPDMLLLKPVQDAGHCY